MRERFSIRKANSCLAPVTGNMPAHFSGRGHLEGTCIAKQEGLLESKGEKRHRKGRKRKRGVRDDQGGSDSDDVYSGGDSDSEDEEEERKVWKPSSLGGTSSESGESPAADAARKSMANAAAASSTASTSSSVEAEIQSLKSGEHDWSKSSKYGRMSNDNFQNWLSNIATQMHDHQVHSEDSIFTTF